jgi:hypothetical protein
MGGRGEIVIDLTHSPPPQKRIRRDVSDDAVSDSISAPALGRCEVTSAPGLCEDRCQKLLSKILAILPTANPSEVLRTLELCLPDARNDETAVEAVLNILFSYAESDRRPRAPAETDEQLAKRMGEEERQDFGRRTAALDVAAIGPAPVAEQTGKIEGILSALSFCLLQEAASASAQYEAYVCCDVVGYGATHGVDNGWGCGYRNIQMLTSHLLARFEQGRGGASSRYLYARPTHALVIEP